MFCVSVSLCGKGGGREREGYKQQEHEMVINTIIVDVSSSEVFPHSEL